MKVLAFLLALGLLGACSALQKKSEEAAAPAKVEEKKAEEKPKPPPPIVINEEVKPPQIATIDPATLKVTYSKGADPRKVVDWMAKRWAETAAQLNQCNAAFIQLRDGKK